MYRLALASLIGKFAPVKVNSILGNGVTVGSTAVDGVIEISGVGVTGTGMKVGVRGKTVAVESPEGAALQPPNKKRKRRARP